MTRLVDSLPVILEVDTETGFGTDRITLMDGTVIWDVSEGGAYEDSPFEDALNSSDWLPNLIVGDAPVEGVDVGQYPLGLVELEHGRWVLGRNPYYLGQEVA